MISVELKRYFQKIGRKGGRASSPAKARAARLNGRRGGRPRKAKGGAR